VQLWVLAPGLSPNYDQKPGENSETNTRRRSHGVKPWGSGVVRGSAEVLRAHRRRTAKRGRLAAFAGLLLLAGCAAQNGDTSVFGQLLGSSDESPSGAPRVASAPASEPEKGCGSAAECKTVLKTMIESPDRGWIGLRPPPDAYANGTRLFAYKALRKQLTCGELGQAVDELGSVSKKLGGPVPGMSADQASRTRALSSLVHGELTKERRGRCRT
jgi:hypothetical protein